LLSVDKQNQPAIEHYKNMGFQPYAQRSLFTWFSEQARADRARRATAQDDTPIESA
jgi:ribosomal protein S18 acetylase RimI-like enzyme